MIASTSVVWMRVVPTLAQDLEQIALSLLPTPEDDEAIRNNMCTLISRIMYENMDFARLTFDGVVITHDFYKGCQESLLW